MRNFWGKSESGQNKGSRGREREEVKNLKPWLKHKWRNQSADLCSTIQIGNFAISIQTTTIYMGVCVSSWKKCTLKTTGMNPSSISSKESEKQKQSLDDVINTAECIEIMVMQMHCICTSHFWSRNFNCTIFGSGSCYYSPGIIRLTNPLYSTESIIAVDVTSNWNEA